MVTPLDGFRPALPHELPPDPLNNDPESAAPTSPNHERIDEFTSAFHVDLLAHDDPEELLQFSKGTPLCVVLQEKVYEPSDPFIKESRLRKSIRAPRLQKAMGRDLRWREKAGIFHLGAGLYAFLPLAQFYGLSVGTYFGFSSDVALRYRTVQPEFYKKTTGVTCSNDNPLVTLPFTPKRALKMPKGSEIEIMGQIRADVNAGLFLSAGEAVGPALFGAAFYAEGGAEATREMSLNVLALDGKGHVRVILRQLSENEASLSVGLAAGCIMELGQSIGMNVASYTQLLGGNRSSRDTLDNAGAWASSNLGFAHAYATGHTRLIAFDVDLNTDAGKRIYRDLLLLQVGRAFEESKSHPGSATVAIQNENKKGSTFDCAVNFFTETLTQGSERRDRIKGQSTLASGDVVSYTEKSLEKKSQLWSCFKRKLWWQEVKVKRDPELDPETYFRIQFENDAFRFKDPDFYAFLRLAQGLGISRESLLPFDTDKLFEMQDTLGKAATVSVKVDVFFTEAGVSKIMNASRDEAQEAFILAAADTDYDYEQTPLLNHDDLGAHARAIMQTFESLNRARPWDIFQLSTRIDQCYNDYCALTGRSLSLDYGLLKRAEHFASLLESQHLLALAAKDKFEFEKTLAALAHLATREETRIAAFSLESGAITIGPSPDSELEHPRGDLLRELKV